jgi:hypothetical protein
MAQWCFSFFSVILLAPYSDCRSLVLLAQASANGTLRLRITWNTGVSCLFGENGSGGSKELLSTEAMDK